MEKQFQDQLYESVEQKNFMEKDFSLVFTDYNVNHDEAISWKVPND
jgi:hypothetical protein